MNHLAHLFLAQPTVQSRVGNLLGDFARGVKSDTLPVAIKRGLQNHWAVDSYTDQHPEVRASKTLFSSRRRRFAGIALDVLYDHFLIAHWADFTDRHRHAFVDEVYADLERGQALMPQPMAKVVDRMIRHDWFSAYADLTQIGFALDRIAERIRFRNDFEGAIEEIEAHYDELEGRFLHFFPDLIDHVRSRAIELPENGLSGESWHWIRYNPEQ
ncbi:acyl carrier protein phosphodiesterase [Marinobacter fonticola]|uniref:acyl carrier protein phosphodiesterase n=1 Tax=Marinobacter fonticola TaxID=2603215 RepID=UPI0011E893A0|nr:ACP phosphodiesterase [Marinobacter fonticola]